MVTPIPSPTPSPTVTTGLHGSMFQRAEHAIAGIFNLIEADFHRVTPRQIVDEIPLALRQELSSVVHTELPYAATSLIDLLAASGIPIATILSGILGPIETKLVLYAMDQVDSALMIPHIVVPPSMLSQIVAGPVSPAVTVPSAPTP